MGHYCKRVLLNEEGTEQQKNRIDSPFELHTHLDGFLNSVHQDFLDNVDPIESGLMDELSAVDLLDSGEEEEIKVKVTRRDKARKLWQILHRVSPTSFSKLCVPILQRLYPHVTKKAELSPLETSSQAGQCVHHQIIKQWSPKRFAEVFPSASCCTFQEYSEISESKDSNKTVWKVVFRLLKKNGNNALLGETVRKMLYNKGIRQLANFDVLLKRGFPCTCDLISQDLQSMDLLLQTNVFQPSVLLDDLESETTDYPSSKRTSVIGELSTECDSSWSWSEEERMPSPTPMTSSEMFHKQDDKKQYFVAMNKINRSIIKASCLRTMYRELEAFKDAVHLLSENALDEDQPTANERQKLSSRMTQIQGRAQILSHRIRKYYTDISDTKKESESIQTTVLDNGREVPQTKRKTLLEKCQKLSNEVQEALHFLNSSTALHDEIMHVCRVWQLRCGITSQTTSRMDS